MQNKVRLENTPDRYIFTNANVLTQDPENPTAESVVISNGNIEFVGTNEQASELFSSEITRIDLQGKTVLPGFIDAHTHLEFIALSRHFWLDVRGASDPKEIIQKMLDREKTLEANEWLVVQGTFGQEFPSKQELDNAFPNRPVVVRWTMHKFIVNQVGLDLSGIDRNTVEPVGTRIQKDSSGDLNGILEEAWDLLPISGPPKHLLKEALRETLNSLFIENGVTTVHEIALTSTGLECLRELAEEGEIPRIGALLTASPGHQPLINVVEDNISMLSNQLGSENFWVQGVKIFMDGGRDGAFRKADLDGHAGSWGLLTRLYPTLVNELETAVKAGLQVCVHAIGDLAQEIALTAVERVDSLNPDVDHRLRIEHFFNESFGTEKLERLVNARGIAVPNPGFVIAEPDDPARRQPPGAAKFSLKTLKRIQGTIPGNSDTAGAQPFTSNPWFTMQCMLELKNKNNVLINPDEVVEVQDALNAFTVDAAYATKQENVKGQISIGKLADLTIVDRDPLQIVATDFTNIKTVATVIGGKIYTQNQGIKEAVN